MNDINKIQNNIKTDISRKTVYCETSFWNRYLEDFWSLYQDKNRRSEAEFFNYLLKAMSKCDIVFDKMMNFDNDEYGEDGNLKDLRRRATQGECSVWIEDEEHPFPLINNSMDESSAEQYYNSVILSSSEVSSDVIKRYGLIVINPSNWPESSYLFKDTGCSADGSIQGWSSLLTGIRDNCNSMVVIDNYIFNNTRQNLYEILKILLPDELDIKFHLNIYGKQKKRKNEKTGQEEPIPVSRLKRWLDDFLRKNKPNLNVETTIIEINDIPTQTEGPKLKIHDRIILTNNMWLECPSGFDLFIKKDVKGTNLIEINTKETKTYVLYPFMQNVSNHCESDYKNNLNAIYNRSDTLARKNRLFRFLEST